MVRLFYFFAGILACLCGVAAWHQIGPGIFFAGLGCFLTILAHEVLFTDKF